MLVTGPGPPSMRSANETPESAPQNVSSVPRLLYLQGTTSFGGSKFSLLTTLSCLSGLNAEARVLVGRPGWLTERLEERNHDFLLRPFPAWRKFFGRLQFNRTIAREWLPAVEDWKPALVHSNEFWWGPHALLLKRRLQIPAVVHLRSDLHDLAQARQYRLGAADLVLAVSSDLREKFAADPVLYGKTKVLHNGYEEAQFNQDAVRESWRAKLGLQPLEDAVLVAGKICENKNQLLLLQAVMQLPAHERPWKLIFAGDEDAAYRARLEQAVASASLRDRVIFPGRVENMGALFAAVDLVVHCSKKEGFPRVVPEAMLAGKPVIATATGGVRDAIPSAAYGVVIKTDDAKALGAEIARLLQAPGLRAEMGSNARIRARQLFTVDSYCAGLAQAYAEASERARR